MHEYFRVSSCSMFLCKFRGFKTKAYLRNSKRNKAYMGLKPSYYHHVMPRSQSHTKDCLCSFIHNHLMHCIAKNLSIIWKVMAYLGTAISPWNCVCHIYLPTSTMPVCEDKSKSLGIDSILIYLQFFSSSPIPLFSFAAL